MNAVPCPPGGDGHGALHLVGAATSRAGGSEFLPPSCAAGLIKRKRRPAGTPDPDAEVVALSPKTLMESDRYVCEICNQGFQRDQNLQMHRRRHKVPWKLLKRPNLPTTKRVYICPERSCLHHDPAHALGDLVGIKKHFRRKHCTEKQWKCDKCSKGYAVQSDYKAHLKTCGTRGHCCDCGRVFSRVESFIEHQDTCSAMKRKATQSESGSERIPAHHGTVDTRNSSPESPSQSSDTTQAMSFTQSGMSDTAARSGDYMNSACNVLEEHARRIQESYPAVPVMSAPAAMPAWLLEHTRRNELELLQRVPTDHHEPPRQKVITRPAQVDQATHGSRTQVTHCSAGSAQPSEVVPSPEMKRSVLEPSLQLSIGLAIASSSVSACPDVKPSFSNSMVLDREWKNYHPRQSASDGVSARIDNGSCPATVEFDATGVNRRIGQAGLSDYNAVRSVSGFLSALSSAESTAGLVPEKNESKVNCSTEMASHYNAGCGRSTSSHHETRVGIHMQESVDPASGRQATRRGNYTNVQLQPAISSVITERKALHLGAAETDHLFGNKAVSNEPVKQQKRIAAATAAQSSCDQTPGNVNKAWTDLIASAKRTTDEARQECEEAQRELTRAESLKREACEQLQSAAAEKAYADRAREVAKRHVEISEAELVKAKRLRLHSQAELLQASSQAQFSPSFCHSCKSTIQDSTVVPSRRSTSTSLTSCLMVAPAPSTALEQSKDFGSRRSTQMFMNPGRDVSLELEIGAKHADQVAVDSHKFYDFANRLSWSAGELWPYGHGYRRKSTSMTIGESAPSAGGNRSDRVAVQAPAQSDRRDQIAPKGLDLN